MKKRTLVIAGIIVLATIVVIVLIPSFLKPTVVNEKNIAVFIPGIVSGNPVYEMLVSGAQKAVESHKTNGVSTSSLTVIEAGTNQSEWPGKLTALCAEEKYDLIFSSNPALPDIIEPLTKKFSKQKFIILDSYKQGNPSIASVQYNQRQQAYVAGWTAAVATNSDLPLANSDKKIALIAAQEYPVMNKIIYPAFVEGAKAYDNEIIVEFRLVGNWYDASKANDLSRSLFNSGVDVILPIAGGASQGVIAAAKDLGFYISWFDSDGYSKAPGYVISSAMVMQEKMAEKMLSDYIEGKTEFGKALLAGMEDDYVEFTIYEPFINSTERKDSIESLIKSITQKVLVLDSPVM